MPKKFLFFFALSGESPFLQVISHLRGKGISTQLRTSGVHNFILGKSVRSAYAMLQFVDSVLTYIAILLRVWSYNVIDVVEQDCI